MAMGDVVEWEGKKYVQTGENRKDKNSWKPVGEVSSVPSKPFTPGEGGKEEFSLGKLYEVAKRLPTPLGVNTLVSDMLDKAAYNAGGYVTDKASILGASPETAAMLGGNTNVLVQAVPSILGGKAIETAAKAGGQGFGRWAMQKAMNPQKASLMDGTAKEAIETMLKEGVNVTPAGMNKLAKEVGKLSGEVDDIVNAAQAQGKGVSIASVLGPVSKTRAGDFGTQVNKADDLKAIDKALTDFLTDSRVAGNTEIPVRLAQDMKTSTYRVLGKKAYNGNNELQAANSEGQKSIIRGLKEGIERAAPDVVPRNQRMSEFLNAIEVAQPGALMAGNKNIGGLAYLAENPFAAGGFLLDRSALAKSLLARFGYSGAPSILGAGAAVGTGAHMQ